MMLLHHSPEVPRPSQVVGIERRVRTVRKTRVRLGRGLLLGLPQRLQNCRSNEIRLLARGSWSDPLQAARQLIIDLYEE